MPHNRANRWAETEHQKRPTKHRVFSSKKEKTKVNPRSRATRAKFNQERAHIKKVQVAITIYIRAHITRREQR